MIATIVLPTAKDEPFSVCTSVFTLPSLKRIFARLAWKSLVLLTEEISLYVACPGSQTALDKII